MMYRKFIAIILASAVAITGLTAAPARADNGDLLKILGGVAAIAIIGNAIAKKRDRDDEVSRRYDHYDNQRKHKHHSRKHNGYHHQAGNNHRARPLPVRVQRKLLPASCKVRASNRNGRFTGYSSWCLQRKFRYANALPGRCATKARLQNNNALSLVYRQGCLNKHGYTAARY